MPSLTYAELGAALRIEPASANRLARRKRWPRAKGNDGRTRVTVPEDALARPPVSPSDSPQDTPPGNPVHAQIARLDRELAHAQIARMEGELAGLREALAEARGRAGAAEAALAVERQASDKARAGLEAQLAAAETRAGEESDKTAKAIAAFSALAERLEGLAQARRSWWRRLVG